MDFSRLNRGRVIAGAIASLLLIIAILFLPWYTLTDVPQRAETNAWLCGEGNFECTGFDTFPILRWLLLAAALAPLILGYILVRGHRLSYPPGEMTMIAGFAATVLIAYNGIIDKPAPEAGLEFGTSLAYGYWVALLSAIAISVVGFTRSIESGPRKTRKAPGTV
ncbi:MAG: hypothetical protein ABWY90_07790 [Solirubrobacterales bacterium]|jgi:hypothetical protein